MVGNAGRPRIGREESFRIADDIVESVELLLLEWETATGRRLPRAAAMRALLRLGLRHATVDAIQTEIAHDLKADST